VLVYAIPFVSDFLQFVDPSLTTALLVIAASVVAIAGVEVVRFVHRRAVAKLLAPPPPALVVRTRVNDGRTRPIDPPTARG
jgi:cation-transporting P-type ATPase E